MVNSKKLYRVWCKPEGRDYAWRPCLNLPPMPKDEADAEATRRFDAYTGWLYETRPEPQSET